MLDLSAPGSPRLLYGASAEQTGNVIVPPSLDGDLVAFSRQLLTDPPAFELVWQKKRRDRPALRLTPVVVDVGRIARSDGHAWLFDTATSALTQITTSASRQQNPSLRGQLLAYEDDRSGDLDIYVLDLTTSVESAVFVSPGDQHLLGVLRDEIAWWSAAPDGVQVFWNRTSSSGPVVPAPQVRADCSRSG